MNTSDASSSSTSSDEAVQAKMQEGLEHMVVQAGVGLVVGGMVGIVLGRGGSSNLRKLMAGFGAGAGVGSAWTRCSMNIEGLLAADGNTAAPKSD